MSKVDESSSKLDIKNTTMEDMGKYTCVCDFENGYKDEIATQLYVYGT